MLKLDQEMDMVLFYIVRKFKLIKVQANRMNVDCEEVVANKTML